VRIIIRQYLQNTSKHILCSITIFENLAVYVYKLVWRSIVERLLNYTKNMLLLLLLP